MALPPRLVEAAMGAGGPGMSAEEQMTEVQLPLMDDLPEGIMIAGDEETVEVEAEVYDHNANLAEVLDDSILGSLSSDLSGKIDEDKSSREDWEEAIAKGLTLLGINYEERNEPFMGASGVTHPLLSEAVTQFQAQAYKEMLPPGGPVKTQIIGQQSKEVEDQAQRVKDFMNYQVTEVMEEYDLDTDQMLFYLPITGSTFKKVYFDPMKQRAVSKFVPAEDLIVPYSATDLQTAERYTHVVRMSENDIRKLQVGGIYRDVSLSLLLKMKRLIQQYGVNLTISKVSVRVTLMRCLQSMKSMSIWTLRDLRIWMRWVRRQVSSCLTSSQWTKGLGKILSVVRNWRETDMLRRKRQYFVHYKFLPGFGFYGFGLLHMIGGLSRAATSILRQLIDAGTLSNLPGGFKARGVRIRNDDEPVNPGEFRDLDAPGGDIRNAIIPLPYKEPSGTLAQLLGVVVDSGRRFAQVADSKVADVNSQAPVGTTVALIEQGSKVISSIHKRLHYAQKNEFRLLSEIFALNPVPYPYMIGPNVPPEIMAQDFDGRVDVLPVSDPSIFSMAQRLSLAQTQLQLAQAAPQMHNMYEAYRRMYDALDIKNIDSILPPPQPPMPVDPATENANILKGMPGMAFQQQDHVAHIRVHAAMLQQPATATNPQAFMMLQSHVQEHIAMHSRDLVQDMFQKLGAQAQAQGEPIPNLNPDALEAAVAQQVADTTEELAPLLTPPQQPDPLVAIRQQELQNDTQEIQRKAMNDAMDFQIDQARLMQAYELAQQRQNLQEQIAEDRNLVNVYRIDTQANLKRNQ